jgi:hypothetical protein
VEAARAGASRGHAERLGLSTGHFDPDAARCAALRRDPLPLSAVLVAGSSYSRDTLKRRLFGAGLKARQCELCGQGELWRERRLALILDHVNGVGNDHRLENLRIVCPNCAATLETHCGRKNQQVPEPRACAVCGASFHPSTPRQRHCSRFCGQRWDRRGRVRPGARKAVRPARADLEAEVRAIGYEAAGRHYGVSGNAVRKWLREARL